MIGRTISDYRILENLRKSSRVVLCCVHDMSLYYFVEKNPALCINKAQVRWAVFAVSRPLVLAKANGVNWCTGLSFEITTVKIYGKEICQGSFHP